MYLCHSGYISLHCGDILAAQKILIYSQHICALVSITGFLTRLKSKEVEVEQEITGKETINAKLSSRAVVKEQGLRDVCLHKRRATQIET